MSTKPRIVRWFAAAFAAAAVVASLPSAAPAATLGEKFRSTSLYAFVDTATGQPAMLRGVNIKRATHKSKGVWQTPYVIDEINNLAKPGQPAFDTLRIALDWPYFQRQIDGVVKPDPVAFAELDKVVAAAQRHGFHVILDPIHIVNIHGYCTEDPVMAGAHRNIPSWAWTKLGANPGTTCETADKWNLLTDDALALPQTAEYLRFILDRYDTDTKFGQTVVAVDLVNEPHADGVTGPQRTQRLIDRVYKPWLATTGANSVRKADPDKPLIITPAGGSASLVGVSFAGMNRSNVILTMHDYFGQSLGTDPTYGVGYSKYGWATQMEFTDETRTTAMGANAYMPYDPNRKAYATRKSEHRQFLHGFVSRAKAAGLPVYIGEFGIMNPCHGGSASSNARYFADTVALYKEFNLPFTVWANGYWGDMSLMWRDNTSCGTVDKWEYFDYAYIATDRKVRS